MNYPLMSTRRVMMKRGLIILIMVFLLTGCGGKKDVDRVEIRTNSPIIYIYPLVEDGGMRTVTVLPFHVPANVDSKQGSGTAALFRDVLLGKQAFKMIKLIDLPYGSRDEAVSLGRQAGTDLVLAGKINYMLAGTRMGGARVDVSVRLLDVRSGDTVWYIEQTLDQRMDYPDTSFLHRLSSCFSVPPIRSSESEPVVPNMLVHIAVDMADIMAGAQTVQKM